jgi:hypothetical protein
MRLALAIFLAQAALSQSLTPPDRTAAAEEALTLRAGERYLRCVAEPILPTLLYTAPEVAAGYTYSIPLGQYTNGRPEHGWSVVASFTPQGGEGPPTYLTGHIDAPSPNQDTVSGSAPYWAGLGTYSVKLALSDDRGGVCRKEWTVTVAKWPTSGRGYYAAGLFIPDGAGKFDLRTQIFLSSKSPLGTPDGVVRAPVRKDSPASPGGPPPVHGITILVDAPSDPPGQLEMLDGLEVLLARIPAKSVRLAVFSLEEGHEIYRQDGFQLDSLGKVREALTSLGIRAVSVAELQQHPLMTPAQLLDSLIQRETHEAQRSDAVLFLGMELGMGSTFRLSPVPERPLPPFSYIHLLRPALIKLPGTAQPLSPPAYNLVSWAVQKLNGKTMTVGSDKQFDQAVEKVERTIQSGRR